MDLGHRGRAAADDRRRARADRGRVVRRRARARVPAPRRADAGAAPHRRRRGDATRAGTTSVIREELEAHDPALLEKPMLTVFNKLDLPAAREAWPAFATRWRSASGCRCSRSPPTTARGWTRCASRSATCCPDAEASTRRRTRPGVVVHRLEAAGDGFTVEREDDALPRDAASASSGSPTRRTSRTRSRPSGSSASWSGPGSTRRSARPGIRPGDTVRIGGTELEWEPLEDDE